MTSTATPTVFNVDNNVWTTGSKPDSYASLSGDISVDVAIVGGGITGISTARRLARQGKRVAVLEAFRVGSGTTGSSTGNLYSPIDKYLQTVEKKHDDEVLRAVAASRSDAVDTILDWVEADSIDCDLQRVPWYLFSTEQNGSQNSIIARELEVATRAGLPASDKVPGDFPYANVAAMTVVAEQAQLNPLSYVQGLARGLDESQCQIYEHSKVLEVEDGEPCRVRTDKGCVTAGKVVMATHSPKGIYGVQTAMEAKREYVVAAALRTPLPRGGVYWHLTSSQHYSVRPYSNDEGDFLLGLGEAHLVGSDSDNEERLRSLENYMREHFDVESIRYSWAAQNYSAADALPYIGVSALQDNVYIATGFAADGLVYGTLASRLISDAILGRENAWADLYDPARFTPGASASGFMKENLNVSKHLVKDYLFYANAEQLSDVQAGDGNTLKLDGEHVAVHRDAQGQLHIVSGICTHMGCVVHWNNTEKSWDCPCHGSRFSVDGEVLEGPAYNDLAKPKQ